jgi:hypothetical protein
LSYIICILLSFIYITFVQPLLESWLALILTRIEAKKSEYNLTITSNSLEAQKMSYQTEIDLQPPAHQIGFVIPDDAESEEDFE